MEVSDFRRIGEKENHRLLVRLTKTQKDRIRALTEVSGFKSVSDFVRITLLNPSTDMKLNEILKIVKILLKKIPPCKCKIFIDERNLQK